MRGRAIHYPQDQLAWIEARKTLPRDELHALFQATFGRDDVTASNLNALCKRRGWLTGRTGRITAGNVPHNKGIKGWSPPGSEKGWFRNGERRGAAARLYQPIGTERISQDGYLERKINDGMPRQSRWRAVHLIEWEATHGPVPKGHCLKCLDGDKANTSPTNWTSIPRAMLPRLAGASPAPGRYVAYDDAPPELRPTILTAAKLTHAASELRKKARE